MFKLIECPRDAWQGHRPFIPTADKVRYLNLLLRVGFDTIDFGSFVSPKAVPQVIDTAEVKAFYKPWTYAWPQVEGFLAVADITDIATTGEREADLYRMMRWQPAQIISVRFKCETSEIARVLTDGSAEPFAPLDPQDPMMRAVCSRS